MRRSATCTTRLHQTQYVFWQHRGERLPLLLSSSLVAVIAATTIHLIDDCITYSPVGNEPRFMRRVVVMVCIFYLAC
ncbi:hypothetical protein ACQJBY_013991 [Aegilops geniculata]